MLDVWIILYLQKVNKERMDNMKPLNPIQKTVVGVQFLFVAFGATVLVPLLVGLDLLPPFLLLVSAR